jgi:glycosyltransferase involved in cell wall biosynthesis
MKLALVAPGGVDRSGEFRVIPALLALIGRLARQPGLERHMHGFKTRREWRPLRESADLLAMSSLREAGPQVPQVPLEAAAAGVPAVGKAVGHFVEWSPSAALAVPVKGRDVWANAIRQVLADEELRLRLAGEAQRRAMLEGAGYTVQASRILYPQLSPCVAR